MTSFSQAGEAMLRSAEGNRMIGEAMVAAARRFAANIRQWLAAMPTSFPPTDAARK